MTLNYIRFQEVGATNGVVRALDHVTILCDKIKC